MVPEKAMHKPKPQWRSQGVKNVRNMGHSPEKVPDSGQSQPERGLWIATVDFPSPLGSQGVTRHFQSDSSFLVLPSSGNKCYCILEERNFVLNLQELTAKSLP